MAPDPQPARGYHHGDLPEALLEAVDELLRDGGVEALSLRRVARTAGVSHTAAAHHFGGWPGLLTAYTERGFRDFLVAKDRATDALGPDASPEARLLAAGRAYVAFAMEHPGRYDVMFRDDLHTHDVPEHDKAGRMAFLAVVEAVRDCLEPPADEQLVLRLAISAWSTVHGLAHLLIDGPLAAMVGEDAATQLRDGVLATLHAGLRAEPGWRADPDLPLPLPGRASATGG